MNNNRTRYLEDSMRSGWDTRIAHDYLGWMNDRVDSDAKLWETGKRDYELLLAGTAAQDLHDKTILDLGCGVGRMLRPAAGQFSRVIGVDIAEEGLKKARELTGDLENLEFVLSSGTSFYDVEDESVDYAISFGVLCNMPVYAMAANLHELSRVMKPGGQIRLQLFVGACQPTMAEDSVAFRSYQLDALVPVLEGMGFSVQWIEDLDVGVDVPDDGWLRPVVCAAEKVGEAMISPEQAELHLVPGGEAHAPEDWPGSATEYYLSVLRAKEQLENGDKCAAKRTLAFALERFKTEEDEEAVLRQLESPTEMPSTLERSRD